MDLQELQAMGESTLPSEIARDQCFKSGFEALTADTSETTT